MDNDNEILFSSFGVEEINPSEALQKSFEDYADTFNQIVSRLARLFNEDNLAVDNLESILLEILFSSNSRREDYRTVRDLLSRYNFFLNEYDQFLNRNPDLRIKLNERGLSISILYYWRDIDWFYLWWNNWDTYRAAYLLQFVGCSYLIVDRLWDVYQFVNKKDFDVYELAHDGCRLINYKWTDFFYALGYIRTNTKLFFEAFASFMVGIPMIGKSIAKRMSEIERKGAAFAEYPYNFIHNGTIQIYPVGLRGSKVQKRIIDLYDRKRRKLNLNDKYGLSVAMFDCKIGRGKLRCLSYAGTRLGINSIRAVKVMVQNVVTDIFQYFNVPSRTYFEAVALANDIVSSFPRRHIYVFGHSLGGGLMQYACAAINSEKLHGYGYNTAGLSDFTLKTIPGYDIFGLKRRVSLISSLHDPVSRLGNLLGDLKYVDSVRGLPAHCLKQLNEKLNGGVEMKVKY